MMLVMDVATTTVQVRLASSYPQKYAGETSTTAAEHHKSTSTLTCFPAATFTVQTSSDTRNTTCFTSARRPKLTQVSPRRRSPLPFTQEYFHNATTNQTTWD
ncbi:unnamed protein product, partial [Scytosiphon promiscuus]